jgi:hypothetical protein
MTGVRFPAGVENSSLRHQVQAGSRTHPASYPIGTGGKAARCESDHSLPSRAEVKNASIYTSTPLIRLRGVVLN